MKKEVKKAKLMKKILSDERRKTSPEKKARKNLLQRRRKAKDLRAVGRVTVIGE